MRAARPRTARRSRPRRRAARRARRASNSSASGSATISGPAEAVHEPEADDRLAAAHQRAGGDLVRLARGDAVGDEPPERRERRQRLRRTRAPPAISSTTSTLRAAVGLDAARRRGPRARRRPRRRRRARAPARASPRVEAVAITRPAPKRLRELDGERADAAGGGVDDDASRPRPAASEVRSRCQAVRPWRSSASAAASSRRRGSGTSARPAPRRTPRSRRCRDERDDALAGRRRVRPPPRAGDQRQLVAREVGVLARVGVGEVDAGARDADRAPGPRRARAPARPRRARAPRARRTP